MYNEKEEIKKANRRVKLVDIVFIPFLVIWTAIWFFGVWIAIPKTFYNLFVGAFLGVFVLIIVDFMIIKFFIWFRGKAGRVKRK